MSDLLLLGLIGGLTLLLLLTLLAFARSSGLLARVAVSAGSSPFRNVTVAYKFHVGPYSETGRLFTESCSVCPRLRSIAVYYDSPHMVRGLLPCGRAWGRAGWGRGTLASKEVVGKSSSWPCRPLLSELKAPFRFSLLGVCWFPLAQAPFP